MTDAMLKFLAGVLIIAIIAVIVSKNSRAAQVIQAFSASFTNILGTIVQPISTPANNSTVSSTTSATGTSTATTPNNNSATSGQTTTVNH